MRLPVGSIPFRLTLVSAASYAAAAAAVYGLVARLPGAGRLVAACAALTAAFAAAPWSQATTAKGGIYLLVAALVGGAACAGVRHARGSVGRVAFPASLALAAHWMTAVTLLPGLAILAMGGRAATAARRTAVAAALAVPALSLFLVLPLCAARRPFLNWGDPVTLDRFAFVVGRAQYAGRLPGEIAATGAQRVAALGDAVAGAGPVVPLLAGFALALVALARSSPRTATGLAAGVAGLGGALYVHGPLRADSPWYLGIYAIPALAWLVALAVAAPALAAAAWAPPTGSRRRAGVAGAIALMGWSVAPAAQRAASADRSREFFTWDIADLLDRATAGARPALLFGGSDPVVFGNWHRWRVEERRAGAVVVPVPLLPMPWLAASLSAAVPGLRAPVPPPRTGAEAVPALLRAWGDAAALRFERYAFMTDSVRAAWPAPGSFAEHGPVFRVTTGRRAGEGRAARAVRARGLLDGALDRDPRRAAAIRPLLFSMLHTTAAGTIAAGRRPVGATALLRLAAGAARSDADRAAVEMARGNLASRDRRLDAAAAAYEAAERLAPGHPGALRNLAMVELGRGRKGPALAAVRRLREAAPDSPEAAELAPLMATLEREARVGR